MKKKRCKKCLKYKTLDAFYKNKRYVDNRFCWCKECCKAYGRTYSQKYFKKHKQRCYNYYKQHPWLRSWSQAKYRCTNPKSKDYKNYGGRGIKFRLTMAEIKELWFRDEAWKLKRPSIDREDNDGHYEFSNCRWIEYKENAQREGGHRLNVKAVEQFSLDGKFIKSYSSIKEASEGLGLSRNHISNVLNGRRKTAGKSILKFKGKNK